MRTNETSMITKLLEATATINNKNLDILNTMMDISVNWDVEISKQDNAAKLEYIYSRVTGNFTWEEKKESYKRTITITFRTDDTWKITRDKSETKDYYEEVPIPLGAKINFDEKTIKIY